MPVNNLTLRQRLMPRGLPAPVAGTSVKYWGNLPEILVRVTFTDFTIDSGDNESLAVGKAFFVPPENSVVQEAEMNVTVLHSDAAAQDETPDVGLGTVIGSGAVAVLGGTATFENIITGQTSGVIDGTNAIHACNRNLCQVLTANGVFLNLAAAWDDVTETVMQVTGEVFLRWRMPNV
jgi:hypothetical protein